MKYGGLLALLLMACAPTTTTAPSPTATPPVTPVQVALVDFEFRPPTLQIAPGTTVVFKNQG